MACFGLMINKIIIIIIIHIHTKGARVRRFWAKFFTAAQSRLKTEAQTSPSFLVFWGMHISETLTTAKTAGL